MEEEKKEEAVETPVVTPVVPTPEVKDEDYIKLKKSNNRKKSILVILLFVMVLMGIIIFVFFTNSKEESKKEDNKQEEKEKKDEENKQKEYITEYRKLPKSNDSSLDYVNTADEDSPIIAEEVMDFLNPKATATINVKDFKLSLSCTEYGEPPFPCSGDECGKLDNDGKRCTNVEAKVDDTSIVLNQLFDESATCSEGYNIYRSNKYYLVDIRDCSPYYRATTLYDSKGNKIKDFTQEEVTGQKALDDQMRSDSIIKDGVIYFIGVTLNGDEVIRSYIDLTKDNTELVKAN